MQMLSLIETRRPSTVDFGLPIKRGSSFSHGPLQQMSSKHTLLAAPVCLLHAVQPLAGARQGCYEGIETERMLVSDASLCFA